MFWNKKDEKRSLPDLPPARPSFAMTDDDFDSMHEKHELPAFPDSPIQRGFSQSAIKDAVGNEESSGNFKTEEMEESSSLSEPPHMMPTMPMMKNSSKTADVFVKIEKFQSARKSLSMAQDQLNEIDELLRKIRETRMREEQELAAWEKEVMSAKTKIQDVSQNLFDKSL